MALQHGKWIKLDQKGTGPGARSSHAITLVGEKAYVFGGEFTPRVPVDNKLHVFDLKNQTWSVIEGTGDVPPPRVGVTLASVGETIYAFGGRDYEHTELNELYSFDTSTNKWTLISSGDTGPPHRSYHSATSDNRHVYIFGGCGGCGGRVNDLWAYDVVDQKWIKYPDPSPDLRGRGGPGLVVANNKIWVVYGFAGEELDDIHVFDLASGQWAAVAQTGDKPTARSVFSTAVMGEYIIIYGGEIDPSDLGHLGAGKFAAEVYAFNVYSLEWTRWNDGLGSTDHPGPRGWCAYARGLVDGQEGLLVYGGNSPTNDRLGDIYFFTPNLGKDGSMIK